MDVDLQPARSPLALDLNGEGAPGDAWGNLGLWCGDEPYGRAAERLALRVGEAAGLAPGLRVLDLGFGTGQQWSLWQHRFGVASIVGLEPDPGPCSWARRWQRAGDRLLCAPAARIAEHLAPGSVDAAVAVDAAYHFPARRRLLDELARVLAPGGRAAWTDLVLAAGPPRAGPVLAAALRSAGIPPGNLTTPERYAEALTTAGWRDVSLERVDAAVLDGFAAWWPAYRRRHRVRARMWLRAELTARALRLNGRRRRLGYVVVAACPGHAPAATLPRPPRRTQSP